MSSPTYQTKVLVIRKIKYGESDLILSMLDNNGKLISAIAKGARKPNNLASSKLELFCLSDVLLVKRPGLDIVKEIRLLDANFNIRQNYLSNICASCIMEFAHKESSEFVDQPRLFDLCLAFLQELNSCDDKNATILTPATFWKAYSIWKVIYQFVNKKIQFIFHIYSFY